ncbi:WYL domain-containing protein [Thalassospira alkalitolerans]|uniref:Uncharacterized protein n=1 Tax=Thalassospira alkalitolerans TaxID=1293890 RepID=A0A1Y2L687_9PROT|nr:WYL domain-containing protein [Thalassospira alkalitolerans]OSQ42817.1 hypothetical protein TALK_21130 [Thalassospira alkalitolerans]
MSDTPSRRPWGVQRRLEFIEFRLYWEGQINRGDISDVFGVSTPQASTDLSAYKELASENLTYDARLKVYLATKEFKPKLIEPDANSYLSQLHAALRESPSETWLSYIPDIDLMPIPFRKMNPIILRKLLTAIKDKRSLEILYHSMNNQRPEPIRRSISPHALASDGLRWHIRAFCHIDHKFKDFIVSRCRDCELTGASVAEAQDDWQWQEFVDVELIPNPKLSPAQQKTIALDYEMDGGKRIMNIRKALFYYFEKRLRFDISKDVDQPKEKPVIIKNHDRVSKAVHRQAISTLPKEACE